MTNDTRPKSCCSPSRAEPSQKAVVSEVSPKAPFFPVPVRKIPGGRALLGTDTPFFLDDGEGPLRKKTVKPFMMTETTITNASFAQFVSETAYVTEAERFGWSFVFHSDVPVENGPTQGVLGTEWWRGVDGANWRTIHGRYTRDAWHLDHPAVHISWNDATAFARWCGGRLPTEAEWEHAARGGLSNPKFPWGETEPDDDKTHPCNIWQGRFPTHNTGSDGWKSTAPARSYEPNGYGLYNMAGNVWEWSADVYRVKSLKKEIKQKLESMRGYRVLKGGSYLCHKSYCYRYRIAARIGNSPDSTTTHQGFRIVWDI